MIDLRPRGPVLPDDVLPAELAYWLRRLEGWRCRAVRVEQRVEVCERCGEGVVREGFGRRLFLVRKCGCRE